MSLLFDLVVGEMKQNHIMKMSHCTFGQNIAFGRGQSITQQEKVIPRRALLFTKGLGKKDHCTFFV